MTSHITNNEYVSILKYYKLPVPKSLRLIKLNAEKIMAEKLCRCIKKISFPNEAKSIGVCTKTIFNNKGFTRGTFKCKQRAKVSFRKTNKKRKRKIN